MNPIIQHRMFGTPTEAELLDRLAKRVGVTEARRLRRVEKILYAMQARKAKRGAKRCRTYS